MFELSYPRLTRIFIGFIDINLVNSSKLNKFEENKTTNADSNPTTPLADFLKLTSLVSFGWGA